MNYPGTRKRDMQGRDSDVMTAGKAATQPCTGASCDDDQQYVASADALFDMLGQC
jgi:hypothetical protein